MNKNYYDDLLERFIDIIESGCYQGEVKSGRNGSVYFFSGDLFGGNHIVKRSNIKIDFEFYANEIIGLSDLENRFGKLVSVPKTYTSYSSKYSDTYLLQEKVDGRELYFNDNKSFVNFLKGEFDVDKINDKRIRNAFINCKFINDIITSNEWLLSLSDSEIDMLVADIMGLQMNCAYSMPDILGSNVLVDFDKKSQDFYHIINNHQQAYNFDCKPYSKAFFDVKKEKSGEQLLCAILRLLSENINLNLMLKNDEDIKNYNSKLWNNGAKNNAEIVHDVVIRFVKSINRVAYNPCVDREFFDHHNVSQFLYALFNLNGKLAQDVKDNIMIR